jgi:cephalosporin hydroxylase
MLWWSSAYVSCCSSTPLLHTRLFHTRAPQQRHRACRYPGPVFAILDSDHSKSHVLQELRVIARLTRRGDRVVVEDRCEAALCRTLLSLRHHTVRSNVNGHPVGLSHGPGPYEAIEAFLEEAPDVFVVDMAAEGKFGFTAAPAGWLVRA